MPVHGGPLLPLFGGEDDQSATNLSERVLCLSKGRGIEKRESEPKASGSNIAYFQGESENLWKSKNHHLSCEEGLNLQWEPGSSMRHKLKSGIGLP